MSPVQTRDFFGHLFDKYHESGQAGATLGDFLGFCRNYLRQNPPAEIAYLAAGLGVRLMDGTRLAFTPDQIGTSVMVDEGLPVIGSGKSGAFESPTRPVPEVQVFQRAREQTDEPVREWAPEPAPEPPPTHDEPEPKPEHEVDHEHDKSHKRQKKHK